MVQGLMADDPPAKPDAVVAEVKARAAEWGLKDEDVAKVGGLPARGDGLLLCWQELQARPRGGSRASARPRRAAGLPHSPPLQLQKLRG